jgi:transcriptional regulator with XRE-family HTH domain
MNEQVNTTQKEFRKNSLRLQRCAPTLRVLMASRDPKLEGQGGRIRQLRKHKRVSQEAVAQAVGVTLRAYQSWERGEGEIRHDNLRRLAEHFAVSEDYIEYGRNTGRAESAVISETLDIGAELLARLIRVEEKLDRLLVAGRDEEDDDLALLKRLQQRLGPHESDDETRQSARTRPATGR